MFGKVKAITDEIFQVGGSGLTDPQDAAVYLIAFDGRGALVDAGSGNSTELLMDNIRAAGLDPARIELLLLTHCHFDHTGGAAELKRRLNLQVVAHELEAMYLERGDDQVTAAAWYGQKLSAVRPDRMLAGPQEDISLSGRNIRAFHVPGHSPGSVVYMTESKGLRILFGQDVHGPLHPDLLSDENAYRRSLRQMISLEPDILCEGHFGIYRGKNEVRRFIESFL